MKIQLKIQIQLVFYLSSFIVTKFECGGCAAGKVFGAQCPTPWLAARPSQLSPNTSGKDKYKYKFERQIQIHYMQPQVESKHKYKSNANTSWKDKSNATTNRWDNFDQWIKLTLTIWQI